jgi:signal transduction histidine kinase
MNSMLYGVNRVSIWLIAGTLLAVSVMHYFTSIDASAWHDIYRRLYYVPILLAAVLYGWRVGLLVGVAASIAFLPHILWQWHGHVSHQLDQLFEIPMFFVAGAAIGALVDRDRHARQQLSQFAQSAAIGRATAAVIDSLKTPMLTISGMATALGRGPDASRWTREAGELITSEAAKIEGIRSKMVSIARSAGSKRRPFRPCDVTTQVINEASALLAARGIRVCLDQQATPMLYAPRAAVSDALSSLVAVVAAKPQSTRLCVALRYRKQRVEWTITRPGEESSLWIPAQKLSRTPDLDLLVAEKITLALGGELEVGYADGELCAARLLIPSRIKLEAITAGRTIALNRPAMRKPLGLVWYP